MQLEQQANILLVDDNVENLGALELMLRRLKQNLVTANSGEEALECIQEHDFAVILLDIQMPGLDGFETAKFLRQNPKTEHTPIIFLTGFSTDYALISKGYSIGAVDYITQPVAPEILRSKVAIFVDLFQKTRAVQETVQQLKCLNGELIHEIALRQQIQEELYLRKREFKALVENSPDIVARYNRQGQNCYVNPAIEWESGTPPEDFLGKTVFEMGYPDEFAQCWDSWFQDVFSTGKTRCEEFSYPTPNGLKFYQVRIVPELTAEGFVESILTITRDITPLKKTELELQQSNVELEARVKKRTEELAQINASLQAEITKCKLQEEIINHRQGEFRALVENAPDIISRLDHNLRHLYVNPVIESITGLSAEVFIGKTNRELGMSEELVAFWETTIHNVFKTGQEDVIEFQFPTHEGLRHYQARIVPEFAPDGSITSTLCIARDISDIYEEFRLRQLAEKALQTNQKQFHAIFNQAAVGIAKVGLDGEWLLVNQKLCDIVGYTCEELLERTFQDITYPEDLNTDLELVQKVLAGELESYSLEKRYIHKQGSLIWIHLTVSCVRDALNEVQYFISIIQDISDKKRKQQEIHLLQTITQAINEAPDFDSALGVVLRKVCEAAGWNFGEAWIPHSGANILELSPAWYSSTDTLHQFRDESKDFIFPLNVGIPGRVWATQQPEWIEDVSVTSDAIFLRSQTARDVGLKSALGVPILINDNSEFEQQSRAIAVFVFFTFTSCPEDKQLVDIVYSVANQLGMAIQRKRTEDTLKQTQFCMDSATDAISWIGEDGRFIYVNDTMCRSLGYSESELFSISIFDIDPNLISGNCPDFYTLKQHGFLKFETCHRRKNGSIFPVEIVANYVNFKGLEYACCFARDITERKQTEQALQQTTEQLRTVLDAVPGSVAWVSSNLRYLGVNSYTAMIQGLKPEDYVEQPLGFYECCNSKFTKFAREFFANSAQEATQELEDCVNGSQRTHLVVAQKYQQGKAAVFIGIDITKRKQAEEERQNNYNLLQSIIEGTPDPIFVKDIQGRYVMVNTSSTQVIGLSATEIIGKDDSEILPTEIARPVLANDQQIMTTGKTEILEESVPIKGELRTFLSTKSVWRDAQGNIIGLIGVARDITNRKRTEQEIKELNRNLECRVQARTAELEAANKELEAFSYSVSHDLRAPLRGIDGFSQALLDRYSNQLDDKGKHYLQRIRAGTQRMGELIDDLLQLSRVTRSEMQPTQVDLSALAREIMAEIQQTESDRLVEIIIIPGLVAQGDQRLLRIALENLLNNAWKFTSSRIPSRIEFNVILGEDAKPVYFVRDNGVGFNMAYANKLFGAFQRLHSPSEFPGTGIGLATVKRIITRHGGRVWAESEVEQGATFYFTL
jgi:PAS domain S-box-containing protein